VLDDVRRFVQDRVEALTPGVAEELAGSLIARAQGVADQITGLAAGFLAWSAEARDSIMQEVRDLVGRQIEEMGVATKADVHRLRERLDRVEAKVAKPSAPAPPPRRTSTAKTSATSSTRSSGSASSRSRSASRSKASGTRASSRPAAVKPAGEAARFGGVSDRPITDPTGT
jgi:hypothetical protein